MRKQLVEALAGPRLRLEHLRLLALVIRIAARKTAQHAAVELDDPRRHAIEKHAVVGDHHHCARKIPDQRFEPFDAIQVEVVGGFVEQQHVRLSNQGAGERNALEATTRQCAHLRLRVETKPAQHLLDPLVQAPAVNRLELVLQGFETGERLCR